MTNRITVPTEIASVVRDKTFYVASHLSPTSANNGDYPLMAYNSFSRYEFVNIAQIDGKYTAASAKVTIPEVLQIIRYSKKIYDLYLDSRFNKKKTTQPDKSTTSLAYSVKMQGKLKGKTPAQVLIENPEEGRTLLVSQGKWLSQNLQGKYKDANQRQIDAINDALNLQKIGSLSVNNIQTSSACAIYDGGMRPLIRKKIPDDVNPTCKFVYELKIEWAGSERNPAQITVQNYYAPVITQENGTLNVLKSKADPHHRIINTMSLSAEEWMNVIYAIEMDMRRFEMVYAKRNIQEAEEIQKRNVQ